MRFLIAQDLPLPRVFSMAAEFVVNRDLRAVLSSRDIDVERARSLLEEAEATRVQLDREGLSYVASRAVERLAIDALEHPGDLERLEKWSDLASLAVTLPFDVNLWQAQNVFYDMLNDVYPTMVERSHGEDALAEKWVRLFRALGGQLSVAVT